MSRIDRAIEALKDVAKLKERGHHFHKRDAYIGGADSVKDRLHGEPISERAFVRAFGDKVKRVRLSNRADFVGLMIMWSATLAPLSIGYSVVSAVNSSVSSSTASNVIAPSPEPSLGALRLNKVMIDIISCPCWIL